MSSDWRAQLPSKRRRILRQAADACSDIVVETISEDDVPIAGVTPAHLTWCENSLEHRFHPDVLPDHLGQVLWAWAVARRNQRAFGCTMQLLWRRGALLGITFFIRKGSEYFFQYHVRSSDAPQDHVGPFFLASFVDYLAGKHFGGSVVFNPTCRMGYEEQSYDQYKRAVCTENHSWPLFLAFDFHEEVPADYRETLQGVRAPFFNMHRGEWSLPQQPAYLGKVL